MFMVFYYNKRLDCCDVGTLESNGQFYSDNCSKSHLLYKYIVCISVKEDTSDSFSKLPDSPYPDISKILVTRNGAINLLQNFKEF